jgi:hypothetical protein
VGFQKINWKRYWPLLVAVIALLADFPSAAGAVDGGWSWITDRFDRERAEPFEARRVDVLSAAAKTELPWVEPPETFERSRELLASRPLAFDPHRLHDFNLDRVDATLQVGEVVRRAPSLAGRSVVVRGRLAEVHQVAKHRSVNSWLLLFRTAVGDPTRVACRVPLAAIPEPSFREGQLAHAEGVVLARGYAVGANRSHAWTAYMVCSNAKRGVPERLVKDARSRTRDLIEVDDALGAPPQRLTCGDRLLVRLPPAPVC